MLLFRSGYNRSGYNRNGYYFVAAYNTNDSPILMCGIICNEKRRIRDSRFNDATAFVAKSYRVANFHQRFTIVRFYFTMTLETRLSEKRTIARVAFYDFRLITRRHGETTRTLISATMTGYIVPITYVTRHAIISKTRSCF